VAVSSSFRETIETRSTKARTWKNIFELFTHRRVNKRSYIGGDAAGAAVELPAPALWLLSGKARKRASRVGGDQSDRHCWPFYTHTVSRIRSIVQHHPPWRPGWDVGRSIDCRRRLSLGVASSGSGPFKSNHSIDILRTPAPSSGGRANPDDSERRQPSNRSLSCEARQPIVRADRIGHLDAIGSTSRPIWNLLVLALVEKQWSLLVLCRRARRNTLGLLQPHAWLTTADSTTDR